MPKDCVIVDTFAVKERYDFFRKTFSIKNDEGLYELSNKLSVQENLKNLSDVALRDRYSFKYVFAYKPIMLELVSRWIEHSPDKKKSVHVLDAVARLIMIYPIIKPLVEQFLDRENDYFISVLQNASTQDTEQLRVILLAYYRLFYCDRDIFSRFIKSDGLYTVLGQKSKPVAQFLALKVLSLYLDSGEVTLETMVENNLHSPSTIMGFYELQSDVNYKYLELNEARLISSFANLPEVCETFTISSEGNTIIIETDDLSENVVSIYGVLVPRQGKQEKKLESHLSIVPTAKCVATLRELAHGLQLNEPMMLVGKAGSGKTFLINELSKYMSCEDSIVKIHLGEQTDAKLLIGTYTSGEKPGSFEWRSGVLTTAVKEGRWVLIEDVDKAPTEVLSILLTLLEKRELSIPSRGEVIKAANGFQLISTVRIDERLQKSGEDIRNSLNILGMRMWRVMELQEPNEHDLNEILTIKYPILKNLVPSLINCYKNVKSVYLDPGFTSLNKGAHARIISIRDLVKLCTRLETLFMNNQIVKPDQLIESQVYDDIFSEATDCFTGAISESRALEPLINSIGESLEISSSRIELYLNKHTPKFVNREESIEIGRAILTKAIISLQKKSVNSTSFATTNHSLRLMEKISVAVEMNEPTLLVGETGTGKTTVVQHLGKLLQKPLTVINVSQQTETGDLLGGYKPVNSKTIAIPIQEAFEMLFTSTFSLKKNERFYKILHRCFNKNQWKNVVRLWKEAYKMAENLLKPVENPEEKDSKKKKRKLNQHEQKELFEKWAGFKTMVEKFEAQSDSIDTSFVFNFVEGSLVKAVRNGDWLLLDEINLASSDTLESISDLLNEVNTRSILLSEKGDAKPIKAHPDFRLFACMNPATDVGKRDLPPGIRSRFTEIYVHSPDKDISDLLMIIDKYMRKYTAGDEWVGNDIAELYLEAKRLADSNLIVDGSNQKPHFSIRTLTRTLLYVCDIVHIYGLRRSLYDGFCMSFLNLLSKESGLLLEPKIQQYTIGRLKNMKSVISQAPPCPGPDYVQFKHYWMRRGADDVKEQPHYIITPFVERNMMNLVRASSGKRFPVLIQGPTSAGKTSMIKYLADLTGHKFVRINNHEHTDLQEYLGTYVADDKGKLSFQEGVLVEALRKGYWIVLDELNLAPTDVLEALNRLLDDNRELFIPETQEVIHPHKDFMLFATQNPPGIYGGRKILSRAFRNRFLELHFDDIPQDELEIILRERCQIAPSYAKKIVESYRQLSIERSASRLFEQKNSFATLRDLFRWAFRDAVGYEELAANGYMLLAERCRTQQEKDVVKKVLEKVMRVNLNMNEYYKKHEETSLMDLQNSVVWTKTMRRLLVLVSSCLKNNEPVLLVGETGCGKTTICQILASSTGKQLVTLNAHQNTETGDILGAQRPVRNRSNLQAELHDILTRVLNVDTDMNVSGSIDDLLKKYDEIDKSSIDLAELSKIQGLREALSILFEWTDGPLVKALKNGDFFLFDEISLADDSVLERLNSVLEPERSLLLAEKSSGDNFITACDGFQFFATMNPGGDYGKKELSPALRNRFTEIWVPSMEDFEDVRMIVSSKLIPSLESYSNPIVSFSEWFAKKFGGGSTTNGVISLRDILAWVEFMNSAYTNINEPNALLAHGASMVFIDALGTNNTAYLAENEENLNKLKNECMKKLSNLAESNLQIFFSNAINVENSERFFKVGLFEVPSAYVNHEACSFNWSTPTTSMNLMRVARALQLTKPILLEGSPGVGKTSLITALAEITGHKLTRINLSEQTDLIDLFGSDVPGEKTGEFVWRDAPFLRAMQRGEWVLLDEMNLANQSVLEGLNACLDHRGETYIPELDKSFLRHPDFVVFAAQNPQYQGGGRKGLPKSFVNRFNVVYVSMLTGNDLQLIVDKSFPNLDQELSSKIIHLMSTLDDQVCKKKLWGDMGSPWEFNLRDTLRWMNLLNQKSPVGHSEVFDFVDLIVKQRFRSEKDRSNAGSIITKIFGDFDNRDPLYKIEKDYIQINGEVIKRNSSYTSFSSSKLFLLECNIPIYETAIRCINNNWPLLLVGPTNSGKTDIIRFLAATVGAKVSMFSMNSDVDSMDILGGFEQVDMTRKISYVTNKLSAYLRERLLTNLGFHDQNKKAITSGLDLFHYITQATISKNNFYTFVGKFECFLSHFESVEDLQDIIDSVRTLNEVMNEDLTVKFEWFDGILVKAIEEGHWLILDNANLCPASVLDRLNSLLETNGSLIMNECNQEDGQPRILVPHKDFRLFLTINPRYGELSRAMRNRAVEVYIDSLQNRVTTFDSICLKYDIDYKADLNDHIDIEKKLGSLKLVEKTISTPLRPSLPPHLSSVKVLGDLCDMTVFTNKIPLTEVFLGTIPMKDLKDINLWSNNLYQASANMDRKFDDKTEDFHNFLLEFDIVKKCSNNYAKKFPKDIHIKFFEQSLIPSLNPYTIPKDKNCEDAVTTSEPIYLLSCMRMISHCLSILKQIETKSLAGKLNELNYIELSAAFEQGRNIKQPPRIPIFSLLKKMINNVLENITATDLFGRPGKYEHVSQLLIICLSALEASSSKDEAKLRAYRDLFQDWYESAMICDLKFGSFMEIYSAFDSAVTLTRGKSINVLWNTFRVPYPSNTEKWLFWEELSSLSDKFDDIVKLQFTESYEEVKGLRDFFKTLFNDILTNDLDQFKELSAQLELGIDKLKEISDTFLIKRRHFFVEEFNTLMRFWFNGNIECHHFITNVSPLCTISTKKIVKLQANRYCYPPVFDLLWENSEGHVECHAKTIVSTSLVEGIISKSKRLRTFPGSHIRQTLTDARFLLDSTLKFPNQVLQNQAALLGDNLKRWIQDIIKVHVKSNISDTRAENISDIVFKESDKFFCSVFERYLLPSTLLLDKAASTDEIGRAFLLFGVALIMLYAPDAPYDPAIQEYVVYDCFLRHKEFIEKLEDSFAVLRTVTSGDCMIHTEHLLESASRPEAPPKPKVYRPEKAIDNLFEEWIAFVNSTANPDYVKDLVNSLDNRDVNSDNRIIMFQQNTTHFLERLSGAYKVYSDLNDVFAGYIYSMKLGFDLMTYEILIKRRDIKETILWPVDPLVSIDSSAISNIFREMTRVFKKVTVENLSIERILVFFLKLFSFHDKTENMLEVFNDTLQTLYYRFSLRRLKAESKEQEESKTFKYTDNEEDYEEEFSKMFPDYENVLSLGTNESGSHSENMEQIDYMVAKAYMEVFTENHDLNINKIINEGSEIFEMLIEYKEAFSCKTLNSEYLSAAITILAQEIKSFTEPVASNEIDFYNGYSIQESQCAVSVVENLCIFVETLLNEWPEHATLIELFRISQEFLQYSAMTPIAKQLQKIEQIYTFMAEWEKYASSRVSLGTFIKTITDLIISWRKLELRTWNRLLESEDKKQISQIGKWWYHLFEIIIVSDIETKSKSQTGDKNTPLLSSLNLFLGKCTFGEFSSRLELLRSFSKHLEFTKSHAMYIIPSLHNIITFYEQFKQPIQDFISEGRKKIEKDISEVILLASWKDVNVDALKQSSRRSHASLFKQIRKYRSILSQTVTSIIEGGLSPNQKIMADTKLLNAPEVQILDIASAKAIVCELPTWSTRSITLKSIDSVDTKMKKYLEIIEEIEYPNFANLANDFVEQAETLRKLTPKVFKKKDKNLASLKVQKNKALNDALKELKRIGLKTHFREDIHNIQLTATAIMSNMPSFNYTPLQGIDAHFFRMIDILPRLRNTALTPPEDIPITSVEKGMAVIENLVFILLKLRGPMANLACNYMSINDLRKKLVDICQSQGDVKFSILKPNKEAIQSCCKWLPVLLDYAISLLDIVCTNDTKQKEVGLLTNMKDKIVDFSQNMEDHYTCDSSMEASLHKFHHLIEGMSCEFKKQKSQNEKTLFIYDILLSWMKDLNFTFVKETSEPSFEKLEQIFRKVFTAILLSFQRLMTDEIGSLGEMEDNWLAFDYKSVINNIKSLRSTIILNQLQTAIVFLEQNSFIAQNSILAKSLITFTLPIINNYQMAMYSVLSKSKHFYQHLAGGSHTLSVILFNLAKDGFCSPEPPSEEVDDNNLHEGTGLGDGSGAQNNSNDIEQDEDLTEDAQKPNENPNEEEDDRNSDEDDAVEMEGDMAGELENASDQEDDGNEEDNDDEDMDEQVDDIEDDDPNAIDDKMWDAKADEDVKEKDTNKQLDNPDNDAEVQAAENENENDAQNGDNANETEDMNEDAQKNEKEADEADEAEQDVDNDGSDEEEVGEQEDEVRDEAANELDADVPDVETMDLPEDMNLDSENDMNEDQSIDESDAFDDNMDKIEEDEPEDEEQSTGLEEEASEDRPEDDKAEDVSDLDVEHDDFDETTDNQENQNEAMPDKDEDIEGEDISDEDPLKENEPQESDKTMEGGQEQTEGLDDLNMDRDNEMIDPDSATQQQDGQKGKGSDARDNEEQEDIGASGETANEYQEQGNENEQTESSRNSAKEAMKQLGDTLKEYHKRRQEIREASENQEKEELEETAGQRPDEFEHVEGANTDSNTQALGTADEDQIQPIDEQKAIEDNIERGEDIDEDIDMLHDENDLNSENIDEAMIDKDNKEDTQTKNNAGAFIGERKRDANNSSANDDKVTFGNVDDELDELMELADMETRADYANADPPRSIEEARSLWNQSELETAELSARLSEQLRLILEPTLATKLKGDYKTGKRLNMKRIIPYIASQFRKDKIWLRRTKPSKREYQIMIALDDSKSMSESKCVKLAFESLCLVSKTLTQLESGGLSIVKFGEKIREVHRFDEQFSNEAGAKAFQWFGFQETKTDIKMLVAESIKIFERARGLNSGDQWQLQIVISDGVCEDHDTIERLVRRARESKIMLVFVIIDGINTNESIMDMSQVKYVPDESGNMQLRINKYLDTFPFEFYVVVRDIAELPEMLSIILRQFFSDLASL